MIVTLNEILAMAEERNCAIGSFNTPNLECIRAVIDTAEKLNVPVIISHAQLHEDVAPMNIIGPVMVASAKAAKVPVCVHLDHCESLEYLQRALDMGFTGIMYDGSTLPYAENVANTCRAVAMSHPYGASVEAELGQMASRESGAGENAGGPVYTDPELALRFVQETGIDALAPSFGTSHGLYKAKPVLDLDRVAKIKAITGLPLVMHGGSGVSEEDYCRAIQSGIRKINYYTYMANAGVKAAAACMAENNVTYFHDVAMAAQKAMAEDAEKAMKVFYNL